MQERVTPPGPGQVVSLPYGKRDHSRRAQTSPLARIHLLGSMRATSFRHADILPRGKKARALLGCLCLAEGARVSRARIAAMLWDRVPDFQGRASFRQAYRELVVAFGPLAEMLLQQLPGRVRLGAGHGEDIREVLRQRVGGGDSGYENCEPEREQRNAEAEDGSGPALGHGMTVVRRRDPYFSGRARGPGRRS